MIGFDEFIKFFGNITLINVIEIILAGFFLYLIYKKVRDYLINAHESEKKRDEQLNEALQAVQKYPKLENEIQELKQSQQDITNKLVSIEEATKRRERNKLRDRLLQNYRYYTNTETNPSGSWTRMESEAFWELFSDYEEAGGDGYVHTVVEPAMQKLLIIEVGKN